MCLGRSSFPTRVSVKSRRQAHLLELERANAELRRSEQSVRILNEQLISTVSRLSDEILERHRVELQWRLTQQVSGVGGWGWDFEAASPWWSPEASRALGISTLTTESIITLLPRLAVEGDRERVAAALAEAEQTQRGFALELRIRAADTGDPRSLRVRSELFFDEEGRPLRRVGTVQDVTAAHWAEEERQALESRLRQAQKLEALGQLAGGIAHDFNNILTAILSHAELVELALPASLGPDTARESLTEIVAAAHRARDLVKQILTFSRKQPVQLQPVRLALVIHEAVKLVRPTLRESVDLRLDVHGEEAAVLANETQIHQVLLNLCANAAHALGGTTGRITVGLERRIAEETFAAGHPPLRAGPCLVVSVADTGCGMDAETLSHVFEPFFTTRPSHQGTGLGLAVTHGIVQSHGGAIDVESRLGVGTTFRLWFPEWTSVPATSARAPSAPAASQPRLTAAGSAGRVLFVDDESSVSQVGVRLLERLGYQAVAFNDPRAALARVASDPHSWDLVITDSQMPGLSGPALAKSLRKIRRDLPIILASGDTATRRPSRPRSAAPFGATLAKPFQLKSLAAACTQALRRP